MRETLGGAVSERRLGDVELIVSELATNSVRHASCDELAMEADVRGDRVLVRVYDQGAGFEPARPVPPAPGEVGGYGLVVLDRLADDWGVQRGERFCVWFEVGRG